MRRRIPIASSLILLILVSLKAGCGIIQQANSYPDDAGVDSSFGGSSPIGNDGGAEGIGGAGGTACSCEDHNPCTDDSCKSGSCNHYFAVGKSCTNEDGGTGACNKDGICVECLYEAIDCSESDSATYCPPRCEGIQCTKPDQCASNFCVDGVCCNQACDKICFGCNVVTGTPGSTPGRCIELPKYENDLHSGVDGKEACTTLNTCDGKGHCERDWGQPCDDSDPNLACASDYCITGKCLNGPNDPCSGNEDCFNNKCNLKISPHICEFSAKEGPCITKADCLNSESACSMGHCTK